MFSRKICPTSLKFEPSSPGSFFVSFQNALGARGAKSLFVRIVALVVFLNDRLKFRVVFLVVFLIFRPHFLKRSPNLTTCRLALGAAISATTGVNWNGLIIAALAFEAIAPVAIMRASAMIVLLIIVNSMSLLCLTCWTSGLLGL